MQFSPIEVGAPPEFGNYVVEQNVYKPETPAYLGNGPSASWQQSSGNSSVPPSLTKLNSILDGASNRGSSAIMSGVSFSNGNVGSMRQASAVNNNGGMSPRSMKLDQILGARSESTLGRGISIRVGANNGGASPTRMREAQASFQRAPIVTPSLGHQNSSLGASPNMQPPNPANAGSFLQSGIASSLSMRQMSFSRDGARSPRAVSRIQSLIAFSEELMEKFSRLDVADRCRVGQRLRADVVSHFQDIYMIPTEDILISFELTDAMQLQATFELPSSMESRTRSTLQFRAKTPVRPELMIAELHKL